MNGSGRRANLTATSAMQPRNALVPSGCLQRVPVRGWSRRWSQEWSQEPAEGNGSRRTILDAIKPLT